MCESDPSYNMACMRKIHLTLIIEPSLLSTLPTNYRLMVYVAVAFQCRVEDNVVNNRVLITYSEVFWNFSYPLGTI